MKKITPLIWLLISSTLLGTAYGQTNPYKDSLLRVTALNKEDTNTYKAINFLYRLYFNEGDFRNSLQYCKKALMLSDKLGLKEKQARTTYAIGLNYTNLNIYDSAKYYLDKCLQLPGASKDTHLLVQYNNTYSILYNYQSDHSTAISYLMKAVELLEAVKSPEIKAIMPQTYMNLCNNLLAENQLEKGIEYGKKALQFTGYPDEERHRILVHLDLMDTYIKLNKAADAGHHLDTAVQINKKLNNVVMANLVHNNQGIYYEYINDLPAALIAYKAAYHLADSLEQKLVQGNPANNIARIQYKLGKYKEAEQYAHIAIGIGNTTRQMTVLSDAYSLLTSVAKTKGDYKKALEFATLNKKYADSSTNSATQKVTLSLESKYQHQKKEKEIAELKADSAEKELLIVKRNRVLMIGGLSAAILLLSIGWLYRNSKQKQTIAEKEQHLQQEQIKFLERQQQVVSLQSMLNGQETERTRIAKDLHDGLGGLFSTVKMNFSVLQHEHPALKESPLFQKSYELVDTASGELRRVAHNMMPEVLMKLGLIQAVQDMCASISSGKLLRVTLQAYGMDKRLNASGEIMLYRILQELLNNIIKHAQATEAIIQFNKNGNRLTVTVEDNGKGFNTQDIDTARHSGMESVKNRVHYLNGNINIDSQKGVGTTVLMEFLNTAL
ncbi:MAG: hypothetical protein J7621_24975 [Niastella sp.]|nr:hypothetical protein [Niastella sp.]